MSLWMSHMIATHPLAAPGRKLLEIWPTEGNPLCPAEGNPQPCNRRMPSHASLAPCREHPWGGRSSVPSQPSPCPCLGAAGSPGPSEQLISDSQQSPLVGMKVKLWRGQAMVKLLFHSAPHKCKLTLVLQMILLLSPDFSVFSHCFYHL